jgi:hypothetical protein
MSELLSGANREKYRENCAKEAIFCLWPRGTVGAGGSYSRYAILMNVLQTGINRERDPTNIRRA